MKLYLLTLTILCIGLGLSGCDGEVSSQNEPKLITIEPVACDIANEATCTSPTSQTIVTELLWNPISADDGNLEVLVNIPNATVILDGAIFESRSSSGTKGKWLSRIPFSRSGCSYGDQVTLSVEDAEGKPVTFHLSDDAILSDPLTRVTIDQGCKRRLY